MYDTHTMMDIHDILLKIYMSIYMAEKKYGRTDINLQAWSSLSGAIINNSDVFWAYLFFY